MIERQFTHDKSVLTKCYFCHTGHASSYQRLLVLNEERLCRGCHPHLRDKTGKLSQILESDLQEAGQDNASSLTFGRTSSSTTTAAPGAPEQPAPADTDNKSKETGKKETHALFIEFLGKSTVVPRENRCGFCHQKGHSSQLATTDIRACAECHIFVQTTLSKSAGRVLNVHQKFGTKVCSQCHDPHSAQYNHLLKLEQPTDYYFAREMKDLTIPAEKLSELDKAKQDEKKAKEQEKKFKKKRKKR
ncbi:MAG: cytochrome c3 family protein [Pseudomonadota bacterium]